MISKYNSYVLFEKPKGAEKENELELDGQSICPLNQQEIASLVLCGNLKVN